jgi:hypothetical protein
MAAFTTEKCESLERKWLFDHTNAPKAKKASAVDDGDLVKAGRRAAVLRNTHPDATFIVHLCTNKQVDDALMQKVYDRAANLGPKQANPICLFAAARPRRAGAGIGSPDPHRGSDRVA